MEDGKVIKISKGINKYVSIRFVLHGSKGFVILYGTNKSEQAGNLSVRENEKYPYNKLCGGY